MKKTAGIRLKSSLHSAAPSQKHHLPLGNLPPIGSAPAPQRFAAAHTRYDRPRVANQILKGEEDSEDQMMEAAQHFYEGYSESNPEEDLSQDMMLENPALAGDLEDQQGQGAFFEAFGGNVQAQQIYDARYHLQSASPLGGHLPQREGLWTFGRSIEQHGDDFSQGEGRSSQSSFSNKKKLAMRRSPPSGAANRVNRLEHIQGANWKKSPHSVGIRPMIESETELSSGNKRSSSLRQFPNIYGIEQQDCESFFEDQEDQQDDQYEPPESTERREAGKSLRDRFRLPSKRSSTREQLQNVQLLSSPEVSEYNMQSTLKSIPSDRFSKHSKPIQSGIGIEELSSTSKPPLHSHKKSDIESATTGLPITTNAQTPLPDLGKKDITQAQVDLTTETKAATSVNKQYGTSLSQQAATPITYDGESSIKPKALAMESSQFKMSGLDSQHLKQRYQASSQEEIKEEETEDKGRPSESDDLRMSHLEQKQNQFKSSLFGGKLIESQKEILNPQSADKKTIGQSDSTSLHFMSKLSSLEPGSTHRQSQKQVRFGGVQVESTPEGESLKGIGETNESPMTPNPNRQIQQFSQSDPNYDSSYRAYEPQPYYKSVLRDITRKHMENLRPQSMRKPLSAAKVFKERLMGRLNDRISYIANQFNLDRECLQFMQRDLAVQCTRLKPYEIEYSQGAGSRMSQTPVLETPPAVSHGGADYTYVTKYTF